MRTREDIQQEYYQSTAGAYDLMHDGDIEHTFALSFLAATVNLMKIETILDVGAGTGRAWSFLKECCPNVRVLGVEPVAGLRAVGHAKGIPVEDLVSGDAQGLQFLDRSFDLVCSFGVLHHVPNPHLAVIEMLRVARKAIFISDHNDYARGTVGSISAKQIIKALGMWSLYKMWVSGGKGYRITADDGLWYTYSIFDSYAAILRRRCTRIHFVNTRSSGPNLYRSASHVAVLGILP